MRPETGDAGESRVLADSRLYNGAARFSHLRDRTPAGGLGGVSDGRFTGGRAGVECVRSMSL